MERLARVGQRIDEVVNIDLIGRPGIHQLYVEAKKRDGTSMCLAAAKGLANVVRPGSAVIICTGALVRPWHAGESRI